jgi:hypothetical protein
MHIACDRRLRAAALACSWDAEKDARQAGDVRENYGRLDGSGTAAVLSLRVRAQCEREKRHRV